MKTIHYTVGYGGKLNYRTICGKEIHSHSDTESATIDPSEVTCHKCCATKKWIVDHGYSTGSLKSDIKRRIYIESDILHEDEIKRATREVRQICDNKLEKYINRVFSEILDFAWHDLEKTWKAVKNADEIYATSSLVPLSGGSYAGAPVIFNGMCERALKENVTGKDVYILNSIENIEWYMIDIETMKAAFTKNNLFMYDNDYEMVKIDVSKIKKH